MKRKNAVGANSVKRDGEFINAGKLVRSYTAVLARLGRVWAHERRDGQRPTEGREDEKRRFRALTVGLTKG